MNITECPHCHRRVAPSDSGECPSCGKNVTQVDPVAGQMRVLVIKGRIRIPKLCFNCAEPARKTAKARISNVDDITSAKRALIQRLIPFGALFSAFDSAKHDVTIRLELPICDRCRKQKVKPEIQSFSFEDREVRVVVHQLFRDAVLGGQPS